MTTQEVVGYIYFVGGWILVVPAADGSLMAALISGGLFAGAIISWVRAG